MQLAELQKNYTSMVPVLEQIFAQEVVQWKYCKKRQKRKKFKNSEDLDKVCYL